MDARSQIARLALFAAVSWSCVSVGCQRTPAARDEPSRPASCPESRRVDPPLPHVTPEHETLDYWLGRQKAYGPLDEPLLNAEQIRRHNLALSQSSDSGEPLGQTDLLAPIDREQLRDQVGDRLSYLRGKLESHELRRENGEPVEPSSLRMFDASRMAEEIDEWRRVESMTPLRCGPIEQGLYRTPIDPDFDRNRCSTVREGEMVQLVARWENGMYLARTSYAIGWVQDATLSRRLDRVEAESALAPREAPALTRRALLTEAFSMLGAPYGWGGRGGGYDCSRFLLDLFGRFGIALPRHSARQAMAGTFFLDVSDVEDLDEKRLILEASAHHGLVLVQFPGHIMLYLGATEEGAPMAIHAFSEYLTSCEGSELETVNRVDRVAVSDFTLGEGTSRGDFLTRASRFTVIGRPPGPALVADAELRPSAPISPPEGSCADSKRAAIFQSPRHPNRSQPLRVIATGARNPGLASLVLHAPDGTLVKPREHRLDGPPYSRWVEVPEPSPGRWTAVFADGDEVLACQRIDVSTRPPKPPARSTPGPAWEIDGPWGQEVENFYAAFIEQLFREPEEDDVTWPSLQALIADPSRNLLYDYRAPGEDAALGLEPDCADLPYFLRAYFAWKMRLPFGYRACTRGRKDEPPRCDPIAASNADPVPDADHAAAFRRFARRLAGTVHSSSPRTLPDDDETDFYPVRLNRRALRPGTVFADPYGHVLVVARWKPQSLEGYGVLIGADAQPDGTVGRRRFWRGSFLFTPKTELVGAGFKAWRPVFAGEPWTAASNDELRARGGAQSWSKAQYRGTADDFYSAMEGLINPRPLDPIGRQVSLVDALEESVQRRLSSVRNGEDFMNERDFASIDMPHGSALFLTTGPWEDFSTPSRDMRLLISIDAVMSFPETVEAHPERFGIRDQDRAEAAQRVRRALEAELHKRRFAYTRSDGTRWELSLADVVARAEALEAAYNPNDCIEVRWGAPEGSEEGSTCRRRAPEDQRARMERYRPWFAERQRPG